MYWGPWKRHGSVVCRTRPYNGGMATTTISIRVHDDDLAEIDRRANARRLSRTAFILGASLTATLPRTIEEEQLDHLAEQLRALSQADKRWCDHVELRLWQLEQEALGQTFPLEEATLGAD